MEALLSDALNELTPSQAVAVNWQDGAMFVLAGPGSGKTRVLITRIAKILSESSGKSFRILALTFTNKAADEMATRVSLLVPDEEHRLTIGTFHSFCMQILQQHGGHIGLNPNFAIYSLDSDRRELLIEAIRDNGLSPENIKYLNIIDKLKSRLIGPKDCGKRFKDAINGQKVEETYTAYEKALENSNALDFGSLILKTYELVTQYPSIAARYTKTYKYWMIDEFQDTNAGQYQLIKFLSGENFKNLFVVADDDQIIYQWNGASYLQIQKFRADFNPLEIQLPTNYRCPPSIVAAANRLVSNNTQRSEFKLPLEAGKTILRYPQNEHISVLKYSTDDDEAIGVASKISKLPSTSWCEVVVIARNRAFLEKVHNALISEGVSAAISQRRDDFRSPQFQWLSSTLKIGIRPLDKRALETLVGAFNRWFDVELSAEDIVSVSELTGKSYLEEWSSSIEELTENKIALEIAKLTQTFNRQPNLSRRFVEDIFNYFPIEEESTSDISEDRAAWKDIVRSIGKSIGRDAPLEQFIQELAIRSKEPPIAKNTVSLMTIHAAKGKEFDYVYLVGLAEDVLPSFQSIKAGEESVEMEEERRNCFVAITRTKECLCLSFAEIYRGWPKKPSRFFKEMGVPVP